MVSVDDPTRTGQDSSDADLGNFFSRPIKIEEIEWGTGTTLFQSIDPWAEYFNNPRVANRIANYNLLRCDLKIKVVINGNGFQYGRALVSYLPLGFYDTLSSNAGLISETLVQASQQPHLFLDPTLSRGGEMTLPFFFHKNNLNIPATDWVLMGDLIVRSINPLKHANGASDKVTISVFAWAENVKLSVLTSVESVTLTPQSGNEVDEANTKGMISGPATTVATIAGALSAVPVIRPFALATEAVANGVGSAAKLLGYSRPALTAAPHPYRPTPVSSLACTTLPDTVDKLTLDDKQELTIDPRISGVGDADPLLIADIAKRESYLTTFDWNIGTAPETLLWNARVSPVTWAFNSGNSSFHFPACAMAALPFRYWTGTMNFRFQIVASAFHKGRIKIVYDPNFLASNEYNTNYLEVVDISEKSDFTISVANGQEFTLLDRHLPGVDSVTQLYSTTTYASKEQGNGVIGVYVVNELTTPNSVANNDIQVNVYVSMADDFQVFVPTQDWNQFVFKPQSGLEVAESENTDEKDAPEQTMSTSLGERYDNQYHLNWVYTGEAIKSFRPMLKRYNLHHVIGLDATAATTKFIRMPMFPFLRGSVNGAIHFTSLGTDYNYVNTILLHWVTLAFQGWRGSIRRKFLPIGFNNTGTEPVYFAARSGVQGYKETKSGIFNPLNPSAASFNGVTRSSGDAFFDRQTPHGHNGCTVRMGHMNRSMEVESPFYSRDRFHPGKTQDWTSPVVFSRRECESLDFQVNTQGNTTTTFQTFVAAGEDFQVYFWTGLPPLYWEANPPSPLP
jgi:hypothetical protein